MQNLSPKANSIAQIVLTLTGLFLIIFGVLIMMDIVSFGENRMLVGGALTLAGFGDLILSWFVFRSK